MCGRFALAVTDVEIRQHFDLDELPSWQPRYNIAPTQDVPVVHTSSVGRVAESMRWGLVPHWSRGPDPRYNMINARAETVASKPAYRDPFKRGRCLVPATGYFEWLKQGQTKQPYFCRPPGAPLFALAGLWDEWRGEGGTLRSFTVITTEANPDSAWLHDRMPVIIDMAQSDFWLKSDDFVALQNLMVEHSIKIDCWPVSAEVNSPENESPELVKPLR